jgi:hypothetical protein
MAIDLPAIFAACSTSLPIALTLFDSWAQTFRHDAALSGTTPYLLERALPNAGDSP